MDCLFCKIIKGEIPATKVYEDDEILAFKDVGPQAPVHILVIPKKHISTILDAEPEDNELIGKMFQAANSIAKDKGINKKGFRLVINCNDDGGQAVYHIHLHLLGGRQMTWPPG